jgi:hypothetical protein
MEEVFGSKETAADLEGVRAKVEHYHTTQSDVAHEPETEGSRM